MVALLGQRDTFLKLIESAFDSTILVRGNEITITGPEAEAERVGMIFGELLTLLEEGHELTDSSVGQAIELIKGNGGPDSDAMRPSQVLGDRLLTARGKHVNQVVVAIAREMAAFAWAIARLVPLAS